MKCLIVIVLYSLTTNRMVTKEYHVFSIRRHKSFGMWCCVIWLVAPDIMKKRSVYCPEGQVIQIVEEELLIIITKFWNHSSNDTASRRRKIHTFSLPSSQYYKPAVFQFPVSLTRICFSIVFSTSFGTFLLIITFNESWM